MAVLWQDVKYALRLLVTQRQFTIVAVLILGLGVGAPTIVFSVVNATLLRELPYEDPGRLVAITSTLTAPGRPDRPDRVVTLTEVAAWRPEVRLISSIGAFAYTQLPIRVGGQALSPVTALLDPQFLPTLGVPLALGSHFPDDPSATGTAIISHRLWRAAFEANPGAVGTTFLVDGRPHVLRGVLAEGFQFPRADASYFEEAIDLLVPPSTAPGFPVTARQWWGIARLAPGATVADAEAELRNIARQTTAAASQRAQWIPNLALLSAETTRQARQPLLMVLAISAVLLLIAITNLMNFLFARGIARLREMAIRRAVGSSTSRIIRQMLTEALVLAAAGGLVGLWLTAVTIRALVAISPLHLPVTGRVEIDWRVLLFSLGVCAIASVIASLMPALHVSARSAESIRGAGMRGAVGSGPVRVQRALCAAQIALGVALLTAAGLLTNSLWRIGSVEPGFRTQGVFGFDLAIPGGTSVPEQSRFYARALEEIGSIPGVQEAGFISFLPPELRSGVMMGLGIEGVPPPEPTDRPRVANTLITSGSYFRTVDIPIVRGRNFEPSDTQDSRAVVLINETAARQFFGDVDPLGRRVGTGFDGLKPVREIVGIVADTHDRGLRARPMPTVYVPFEQYALPYTSVAVRATAAPDTIVPVIRERLARINPSVPMTDVQRLEDRLTESLREPRFYTVIAAGTAVMAVFFVTFGLYGLLSYSVSRRTAELGLRVAVGADPRTILRLVMGQGLAVAALGIVTGLGLAALTTRWLQAQLFEVQPLDSVTFGAAAALALLVTLLAVYAPARRASRIDPLVALRHE